MIRYTLVTPDDLCSDPGYFPCNASYCVPKSWFCDGNVDCVGGKDEECCRKFQVFFYLNANIHLFKVNNPNTRKVCEIYSKLITKTLEDIDASRIWIEYGDLLGKSAYSVRIRVMSFWCLYC